MDTSTLKDFIPMALNIAGQTVGFDLDETSPDDDAEKRMREQLEASRKGLREPGEHEHVAEVYTSGGWKYEIFEDDIVIDPSKDWKAALDSEDIQKLGECGVKLSELESDIKGGTRVGLSDWKNVLIIRTPDSTWMNLCGREWHYDLDTKQFKLARMS